MQQTHFKKPAPKPHTTNTSTNINTTRPSTSSSSLNEQPPTATTTTTTTPNTNITLTTKLNFLPLLHDIRRKLGADYTFYRDFLDGVLRAHRLSTTSQSPSSIPSSYSEDTSAYFEQVAQLLQGREEDVAFSHQGVLFLLGEMGVKIPVAGREADEVAGGEEGEEEMSAPGFRITSAADEEDKGEEWEEVEDDDDDDEEEDEDVIPEYPQGIPSILPSSPSDDDMSPPAPSVPRPGTARIMSKAATPLKLGVDPIFFTTMASAEDDE
ncbi:hypothetical protein N0V83_008582 [Neocucurbitaria cava]|uniref:Uncharacterized protein n=1 Tax=Neocucurbitaria cava TaxID=798079 RepID=A0A9W9CI35_9PLEO|nr:hypothetical protein N0V83_008582 [Neocucurbitaria cava]